MSTLLRLGCILTKTQAVKVATLWAGFCENLSLFTDYQDRDFPRSVSENEVISKGPNYVISIVKLGAETVASYRLCHLGLESGWGKDIFFFFRYVSTTSVIHQMGKRVHSRT